MGEPSGFGRFLNENLLRKFGLRLVSESNVQSLSRAKSTLLQRRDFFKWSSALEQRLIHSPARIEP